jgi:WD40 repeat protein
MTRNSEFEASLDRICRSEQFESWQRRLAQCWDQKQAKDKAIREAREAIAAQAENLSAKEVSNLQRAAISRLMSATLKEMNRARPPAETARVPMSRQDLGKLIIRQFPYPIASSYRRLNDAESPAGAFACLLDTFESLLYFLMTVVLSNYWHEGAKDAENNRRLLGKLYKGALSTGDLMELLRETARLYLGRPEALAYRQLAGCLFMAGGEPTPTLRILEEFVAIRNEKWGHGAGRDDRFYANIIDENRDLLDETLGQLDWLSARVLYLPKVVGDDGRVTLADVFEGDLRSKGQRIDLQLDPSDLHSNGGDVVEDKTLLLVDQVSKQYLPLFPLSLFHFQTKGQGMYFLNKLDWARGAEQLKQVFYVAYDPLLERHRASRGEAPVSSIEVKVRQLSRSLSTEQTSSLPVAAVGRADYNLPEVWTEQTSHLRTFAGRAKLLANIDQWIEETNEGGYFLLLGMPGQGKSALLSQLACRRGLDGDPSMADQRDGPDTQASHLHMMKSHKNPRRFMQFLLWQAESLAGSPLGESAFQGDVDDLRNALVGALEQVCKKHRRALIIIDALDELDHSGERINFLPENLPSGVRVVLSCRPEIPLVKALERRLRRLSVETLPPLTIEDLPFFLESYLDTGLLGELRTKLDFDGLFERTKGNPLFLKRAVERILDEVRQSRAKGTPIPCIDILTFPNTVEAVFEDIYREITGKGQDPTPDARIKARLVQLLSTAQEPLSIGELRNLLRADAYSCSLEDVRDLVMQMSEYLLSYDGERFLLFHQGFVDYMHRRLMGDEGVTETNKTFCRWLGETRERRSLYRLRHLPMHLTECAARLRAGGLEDQAQTFIDELMKLLADFDFMQEKVSAGMTFDLIRDYQTALLLAGPLPAASESPKKRQVFQKLLGALGLEHRETVVRPETWHRFIDSQSHILIQYPHLFLQQALNQPASSPISRFTEMRLKSAQASPSREFYLQWVNKPAQMISLPLRRTLIGHTNWVSAVALTADGRQAVSGGEDRTLRVWDLTRGQCLATLEGHRGPVRAVALAPDGRRAVSGSGDRMLRVWDLASGHCLMTIEAHKELVSAVAVSADGHVCVSASWDKMLKVWDLDTGRHITTFEGHVEAVTGVALTTDGRQAVSASRDGTLKLWSITSGQCLSTLTGHSGWVNGVALTPDCRQAVSASSDGTLRVWDLASKQCFATLGGRGEAIWAVALTSSGGRAVSGGLDKKLRVWNLADKQHLVAFEGHTESIEGIAITSDDKQAVSASRDGTLKVWDLTASGGESAHEESVGSVNEVALTPDGKQAVFASNDGTVKVWDVAASRLRGSLEGHLGSVTTVAITPDGRLAVSGSWDKTLMVWDLANGRRSSILQQNGHTNWVSAVALMADGKHAVSVSLDRTLKVWDLASGECLSTLIGHANRISALALLPDGRRAISGCEDGTLRLCDLPGGRLLSAVGEHKDWITAIAVTPDGKRLVSASRDGNIKIWDLEDGRCVAVLDGHAGGALTLALTSDAKMAVSGGEDCTLKVWDLATAQRIAVFPAGGPVSASAVSKAGLILYSEASGRVYLLALKQRPGSDQQ